MTEENDGEANAICLFQFLKVSINFDYHSSDMIQNNCLSTFSEIQRSRRLELNI